MAEEADSRQKAKRWGVAGSRGPEAISALEAKRGLGATEVPEPGGVGEE